MDRLDKKDSGSLARVRERGDNILCTPPKKAKKWMTKGTPEPEQ